MLRSAARSLLRRQATSLYTSSLCYPAVLRSLRSHYFPPPKYRCLSVSATLNEKAAEAESKPTIYRGPLTPTFRRLKIFSLSSLTLSFTLSPFIFLIESALPLSARFALAATALGTSGISTALVGWAGRPYVTTLRYLDPKENNGTEGLEMTTLTLGLHRRITRVYDSDFLVATERAFAKWELAKSVTLPALKPEAVAEEQRPSAGEEEVVAETTDADGKLIGRWVVKWGEDGEGTCHEVGQVVRYFHVHEELLR